MQAYQVSEVVLSADETEPKRQRVGADVLADPFHNPAPNKANYIRAP